MEQKVKIDVDVVSQSYLLVISEPSVVIETPLIICGDNVEHHTTNFFFKWLK